MNEIGSLRTRLRFTAFERSSSEGHGTGQQVTEQVTERITEHISFSKGHHHSRSRGFTTHSIRRHYQQQYPPYRFLALALAIALYVQCYDCMAALMSILPLPQQFYSILNELALG